MKFPLAICMENRSSFCFIPAALTLPTKNNCDRNRSYIHIYSMYASRRKTIGKRIKAVGLPNDALRNNHIHTRVYGESPSSLQILLALLHASARAQQLRYTNLQPLWTPVAGAIQPTLLQVPPLPVRGADADRITRGNRKKKAHPVELLA